jgi:large subunit ribosomal protein L18
MYAQVIDDREGRTLASASSLEREVREGKKEGGKVGVAMVVGELVGKRALDAGVKQVVFDRGCFLYHGRVKAVAEGARKSGLEL